MWCALAWSQTEVLTLERALTLAEQSNPQLRAGAAAMEGAQASIVTARQRPNPELNANFGGQQGFNFGNVNGQLGIYSFSQPLELNSVRRARIHVAEMGRDSNEYAIHETQLAVPTPV